MMAINRRYFLSRGSLAAGVVCGAAGLGVALRNSQTAQPVMISAADTADGQHCLVGQQFDGKNVFCIAVPERAHQAIAHPFLPLAIYFGRRPSTHIYIVDLAEQRLTHTIEAPAGRHFYGHGAFNLAGDTLYCSENNFQDTLGVISAYSVGSWQRAGEFSSGGLGPHQIERYPQSDILVVANGGLETHPDSEREVLNLDTMAPNLSYIDLNSQQVIETVEPPHHQMSTRHFAISNSNQVVLGVQDQKLGALTNRPLVFSHRRGRGEALKPLQARTETWLSMNQYIASIAVSDDGLWGISTTPRGNLVSLWDLHNLREVNHFAVRDVAGAMWQLDQQQFLVSTGLGRWFALDIGPQAKLTAVNSLPNMRWDNHLNQAINMA